jgi:DUF4097 and DUF4098 domain-containing protein YvlB
MQAVARIFPLALIVAAMTAPVMAREIGSFDRTLRVNGPVDLDVTTNSGRISVRRGDTNSVRIHGVISVSDFDYTGDAGRRARQIESNPPVNQSGNSIRIDRVDAFPDRYLGIAYELIVPERTRLHSRTGSGGQSVTGIAGPVEVMTGSGEIQIADIADEVSARTGSGRIELDSVKGRVEAQTGSGGIRGSNLSGPVTARTGSGGVTLHLPPNGGFDLHAQTGSGRVYVAPPITMQSTAFGRHEVRGQIRGGGPMINVSTGSGGVDID